LLSDASVIGRAFAMRRKNYWHEAFYFPRTLVYPAHHMLADRIGCTFCFAAPLADPAAFQNRGTHDRADFQTGQFNPPVSLQDPFQSIARPAR
jgi:hypothetical protein